MKKIVAASDSFKGSLSSLEVATCIETAVKKVFPECEVEKIPVADGGEGTVDALVSLLDGTFVEYEVHDPLMRPIKAVYGILDKNRTAVIEMASASGLTLISPEERNPMLTTTYGTGELIRDALVRGCSNILIGIGGSATNDAGTGVLQALGFRFYDKNGKELGQGGRILEQIHFFDTSDVLPELKNAEFAIACDVDNPFSGINGAAYVYAGQKGADSEMIEELDKGLKNFAAVIKKQLGKSIDAIPGAGAAGGLGGGFVAFMNAVLKPGIGTILDAIDFDQRIRCADLIITGEGKLDSQTIMGKVPVGVLEYAKKQNIPVIAIGGEVDITENFNEKGFLAVFSIQPGPVTLDQAMDKNYTSANIIRCVEQQLCLIRYYC